MHKLFLSAAALSLLAACNNSTTNHTQAAAPANVDSLNNAFERAWNNHDSTALVHSLADDAVLLSGRDKMTGRQQISDRWIHNNMPVTSNLKTDITKKGADDQTAFVAGTWTLDVNPPGRSTMNISGNHTFIWRRQNDTAWRLSVINIEDHDPETNNR